MKKYLVLSAFIVGAMFISKNVLAQANWEAGVRFGSPTFAIDATIPIGISPRLHAAA